MTRANCASRGGGRVPGLRDVQYSVIIVSGARKEQEEVDVWITKSFTTSRIHRKCKSLEPFSQLGPPTPRRATRVPYRVAHDTNSPDMGGEPRLPIARHCAPLGVGRRNGTASATSTEPPPIDVRALPPFSRGWSPRCRPRRIPAISTCLRARARQRPSGAGRG